MTTENTDIDPHSVTAHQCRHDRIVWIDCEMTGLDPQTDVLVEIAVVVTDANLNPLDGGIDIVIFASDEELAQMDDFVTNMHDSSGLTDEIRKSTITLADAENQVLEYIERFVPVPGLAPLAGNSIGTDRGFIARYMPKVDAHLHYRMIDVSSIKELTKRWLPRIYSEQPQKGMAHRALADILESLRELDYYRRAAFVRSDATSSEAKEAARAAADRYPI